MIWVTILTCETWLRREIFSQIISVKITLTFQCTLKVKNNGIIQKGCKHPHGSVSRGLILTTALPKRVTEIPLQWPVRPQESPRCTRECTNGQTLCFTFHVYVYIRDIFPSMEYTVHQHCFPCQIYYIQLT